MVRRALRASTQWSHERYLVKSMERAISGQRDNLESIAEYLRNHVAAASTPCVLISQAQRSGGSLLSQLFDSHPELAAYPMELRFGFSMTDAWPSFDLRAGAEQNFRLLFDPKLVRDTRRGYAKGGDKVFSEKTGEFVDRATERLQFYYAPYIHYSVFEQLSERMTPRSQRGLFDSFFCGFFNSWLDRKAAFENCKWVTAFAPRLANEESSARAFFSCYPDGRLIQIVRDPRTWLPSAKKHLRTLKLGYDVQALIAAWRESAGSIVRNKNDYGDRVVILTFEGLLGRTEPTMRKLSDVLGIGFDPILLRPTFNGTPISANSSFAFDKAGVIEMPLARAAVLSDEERVIVERDCLPLYQYLADAALDAEPDRAVEPPR